MLEQEVRQMQIYKNDVCISMEMDEFLDILESNLFDELLTMITELANTETSTIEEIYGDYDGDMNHQTIEVEDMDSFIGLLKGALDEEGIEWEISEQFMAGNDEDQQAWWGQPVDEEDTKTSNKKNNRKKNPNQEDTKVKRILDRYKDVGR
jgi:hypothetical protein